VPGIHERDQEGQNKNKRIKIISHEGHESQSPDTADAGCENGDDHPSLGLEVQVEDKQDDKNGANQDEINPLYTLPHVPKMHGLSGYGYDVVFVLSLFPDALEFFEDHLVVNSFFKKVGGDHRLFAVERDKWSITHLIPIDRESECVHLLFSLGDIYHYRDDLEPCASITVFFIFRTAMESILNLSTAGTL